MRVRFRGTDNLPESQHERAYVSRDQTFLTRAREYEVHAVSVYDGVTFLQVVDDKQTPVFLPRTILEVIDSSVPPDWVCNAFCDGPVQLVLGPAFLARDAQSYSAMIDQERPQVEQFWRRLDQLGESVAGG